MIKSDFGGQKEIKSTNFEEVNASGRLREMENRPSLIDILLFEFKLCERQADRYIDR